MENRTGLFDDRSSTAFYICNQTKKKNGFHIYWLSLKQNEAIISEDCKKGFEFEIKTDKKRWHCTLPPSVHRDDANFRYKNYRQDKLIVSYKLYDKIMKLLAECLKTEGEADNQKYFGLARKPRIGHRNVTLPIISNIHIYHSSFPSVIGLTGVWSFLILSLLNISAD